MARRRPARTGPARRGEVARGGTHPRRRRRPRPRAGPDRRGRRRAPAAAPRRRRPAEGPVPLPRREVAFVLGQPAWLLPLFRLWGEWRRHLLPAERRAPFLRRGRRDARRPLRRAADVRAGLGRARPAEQPAHPARRGQQAGAGVLHRAARPARGGGGADVPRRARVRPGGGGDVRAGLRARGLGPAGQAPAQQGLLQRGAARGGPGQPGPAGADRPVPPPAGLADQGDHRRGGRVRRAQAVDRPGRRQPQVPQHPRDAALQEVARAVRPGGGQEGHRAAPAGGRRRGLHRRHGLPPRGRADGGRDLRHRVRQRPHQRPAPAAHGLR